MSGLVHLRDQRTETVGRLAEWLGRGARERTYRHTRHHRYGAGVRIKIHIRKGRRGLRTIVTRPSDGGRAFSRRLT